MKVFLLFPEIFFFCLSFHSGYFPPAEIWEGLLGDIPRGRGRAVDISEPEVVQGPQAPVTSGGARHFPDGVHLQITTLVVSNKNSRHTET